jgi:hypothetical protein
MTNFLAARGVTVVDSTERAALMSMWYQSPGGSSNSYFGTPASPSNLVKALVSGDRAEAWFEIRYRSAANGGGVVTRRFAESQMFGLYETGAVTPVEAQKIYAMLQRHRSVILDYERKNGEPPEGGAATTDRISDANTIYGWTGPNSAYEVQSLTEVLQDARDAFVGSINGAGSLNGVPALVATDWNAASIYYDPSSDRLDARADDGKGNGLDKNLLVAADGTRSPARAPSMVPVPFRTTSSSATLPRIRWMAGPE